MGICGILVKNFLGVINGGIIVAAILVIALAYVNDEFEALEKMIKDQSIPTFLLVCCIFMIASLLFGFSLICFTAKVL
jgi:uncharacterized membrane protein